MAAPVPAIPMSDNSPSHQMINGNYLPHHYKAVPLFKEVQRVKSFLQRTRKLPVFRKWKSGDFISTGAKDGVWKFNGQTFQKCSVHELFPEFPEDEFEIGKRRMIEDFKLLLIEEAMAANKEEMAALFALEDNGIHFSFISVAFLTSTSCSEGKSPA